MTIRLVSLLLGLSAISSSAVFAVESVAVGKELLECTRSYGEEPKTYTDCTFHQQQIFPKTDYALKYDMTYSFACRGGQLNFGLKFGEGDSALYTRFDIGSVKKSVTYEGRGPIATFDRRTDNTFGAMFVGKCSVTIDSAKVSLSQDYLDLFDDRLDIISLLGTIHSLARNLDLNVQTLSTLIAKADLGSLHTLIRGVRDNLNSTIKAKESSAMNPPNPETIKSLKITLLDLDTTICMSPILREKNLDICQELEGPSEGPATDTEKDLQTILVTIRQQTSDILQDVTDSLANNVQKIWDISALVDDVQRDELRKKACTRIDNAGLKSSLCVTKT